MLGRVGRRYWEAVSKGKVHREVREMAASRRWASTPWGISLLVSGAMVSALVLHVGRSVRADQSNSQNVREIHLGRVRPDGLYALTVWVKDPAQLQGNDAVLVTVNDASGEVESKWLHTGDLDFYLTLHPRAAGLVNVALSAPANVRIPDIGATPASDFAVPVTRSGPIRAAGTRGDFRWPQPILGRTRPAFRVRTNCLWQR